MCHVQLCCSASAESGSPSGWIDYFGQAIRTSVNYLPTQVSEVLTQSRDYAVAKLPVSGVKNMCAIATYVCCACISICHHYHHHALWMFHTSLLTGRFGEKTIR